MQGKRATGKGYTNTLKPRIFQSNASGRFAYNLECLTRQSLLDKGKPGETQGRKAKGLRTIRLDIWRMAAWPPKVRQHSYIRRKSGPILERDRTFCLSRRGPLAPNNGGTGQEEESFS